MFYKNSGTPIQQIPTIGVTDLSRLSQDSLRDAVNATKDSGCPGSTEDNGIVPIVCRKNVSMVDVLETHEDVVGRSKAAFSRREKVEKLQRELSDFRERR